MRVRSSSTPVLAMVIVGLAIMFTTESRAQKERSTLAFDSLFREGGFLEDRNGDGIVDLVNARIVVPEAATISDVAGAAEIAARLGYESTATDIPLIVADTNIDPDSASQTLILLGEGNRWTGSLHKEWELEEGQGAAVLVRSAFDSKDALFVYGADEAGREAAARAIASRVPFVGRIGGARFAKVEGDVEAFLSDKGIRVSSTPQSIGMMADDSTETQRISIEVALTSAELVQRATSALREVVAARDRGETLEVLSYAGLASLEIQLISGAQRESVVISNGAVDAGATLAAPPGKPGTKQLDLSSLYTTEGLFDDTNNDRIPDANTTLLVLGEGSERPAVGWLATRLGLESAGIRLPLTRRASNLNEVPKEGHAVLIERQGDLLEPLRNEGKLRGGTLGTGEGLVQVVPKTVEDSAAVVVTGADEAGLDAALAYMSQRLPHLDVRGKDQPTLGDVAEEARRFLGARSAPGQAASAVYKLDQIVSELEGLDLERVDAKVYIDEGGAELESFLERRLRSKVRTGQVSVEVASLDIHDSITIHEETVAFDWEVDDFRKILRQEILPSVSSGSKVELELRLSESPEIRRELENEIRAQLKSKAGGVEVDVQVLSSYKAGYSWLTEVVAPAIAGIDVAKIDVRFAELKPEKWQEVYSKIRWLLELYPVDEVLARDLGIPMDSIGFMMTDPESPTYEVVVTDRQGRESYRESFEAKYVVRTLFDHFPSYDKAHVTTGWVTASVDGETVVDERIVTDIEKFWDHYQQQTLPRVHEHVMDLYEGKPRARYAPYFGELRVDLTMSEPNYRTGIDEEIISSLEAVHEDIYFETIAFFDLFGLQTSEEKLWHPGRILPYMHPAQSGSGKAKILFTGKPAGYPQVVVTYKERGVDPLQRKLEIAPVDLESPRAAAVTLREGSNRLEKVFLECKVNTVRDEREALLLRASADEVDRQILSQEQAGAMVEVLAELQQNGLYTNAFGYSAIGELEFVFQVDGAEASAVLESTGGREQKKIEEALGEGYQYRGERIVHWDTPIPPDEAEEMVAKLQTFPELTAYHAGRSFLGRDIWAMDVMLPVEASHWSQAKASTVKPVVVFSARQHANEVSSTSHVLRLAELIATDDTYKRFLDRVNVVVHPITNPDGAALAYELSQENPDFMLHAGYLGALGIDMTTQQWEKDPIYPEAKVRAELWKTWLPDLYLNPHGYPKHEWVQYFAGYVAWVRARFPKFHDWYGPRGWFMPGFKYVEDPKYPHHKEVAYALRDHIVEGINSLPEIRALNERMYARYDRYGGAFDPENFKRDYYEGVRIYEAVKGVKPDPTSNDPSVRYPNVTVAFWGTEAPDETAYGDWLELVASAGLEWDRAHLEYLFDSDYEVKRTQERLGKDVRFATIRARPPRPKNREVPER